MCSTVCLVAGVGTLSSFIASHSCLSRQPYSETQAVEGDEADDVPQGLPVPMSQWDVVPSLTVSRWQGAADAIALAASKQQKLKKKRSRGGFFGRRRSSDQENELDEDAMQASYRPNRAERRRLIAG